MNRGFPRLLLLSGLISLVLYAGYDHWLDLAVAFSIADEQPSAMLRTTILWIVLWGAYLPALWWVARRSSAGATEDWWSLIWVLTLALLYRLVLIPGDPDLSSDFYRYLWDGRLVHAGLNPYAFPPTSAALDSLRVDVLHSQLNRPDTMAVYPPLAQWVFGAVSALRPDALGLRIAFLFFEALGVGVLLLLLRRVGRPLAHSLVYLWNPLIVLEITRGAHSDSIMLPFLLAAVYWRMNGRQAAVGVALGLATLARLYPAVILPALMRRTESGKAGILGYEISMPLAFILTLSVGYFPFALMDGGIAGQIPGYIGSDWEEFNAGLRVGLRYLLSWLVSEQNPWMYANAAGLLLLGGFLLLCAHALIRSDHDVRGVPARAAMLLGGWLLLAMPSAEPWYAWGLMALTAITLSPAWIWFSGALGLTYLKYVEVSRTLPTWVLVIEYVPTLLLLGYAAGRSAALKSNARGPARDDWPRPLPPSDQRWIKLPLYLVGVFPVIAILIALYFLLS